MTRTCNGTDSGNDPLFQSIWAPMPADHMNRGAEAAKKVVKVGDKLVIGFSGMSNWRQEIQAFTRLMRAEHIRGIVWFNVGKGNWPLDEMVRQDDAYWKWVKELMVSRNIITEQIKVWFVKNSVRHGTTIEAYKFLMQQHIERTVRELPYLEQIFISSAIYSGYGDEGAPRSEPGAFYEGMAVDQFVNGRIGKTPWTSWGPYLWANGMKPRDDDLIWECNAFEYKDGIHPDIKGENLVAEMMYRFMRQSPATTWFTGR